MSKSTKAVIFSGLGFPGAGHLYLKSYPRALTLISVVALCLGIFMVEAIEQSKSVIKQMDASGNTLNINEISALTSQALQQPDTTLITLASFAFIACWVFGVIDSYRLGKRQ